MVCSAESFLSPEPTARLLLTCEHASNAVPSRWAHCFSSPPAQSALALHRGWDPGASELALAFAVAVSAPCVTGICSRLLVDLNRSPDHPQFWSEFTCGLPPAEKAEIVQTVYDPFRATCRAWIESRLFESPEPVFHLSVHSFTPVLDGVVREADIGILYDPARPLETRWAAEWESALRSRVPHWRVRHNDPYLGIDDGHTTSLRKVFGPQAYAGIELEINQCLAFGDPLAWKDARRHLVKALSGSEKTNHG